jgi:hypothetical protein
MGARAPWLPDAGCRRTRVKAPRLEWVIFAASVVLLVLLGYERHRVTTPAPPSTFSTYDAGPNGYAALFAVMRRAGVAVRRFERPLGLLDRDLRTLVISAYQTDPSSNPLDAHDASALRRFVAGGGRLVMVGPAAGAPGVKGKPIPAVARRAVPVGSNPLTDGVHGVEGPIAAVMPFSEREGVPLLANRAGIVALAYAYGKGEVVVVTAPALFSNANLQRAGNAAFAYDLIAGHGPAAFDEYVHGYDAGAGLWAVLPAPVRAAIWIALAVLLLAIVGENVPFAPPLVESSSDERGGAAYLEAMATLMRRARAQRAVAAFFAHDARRRARVAASPAVRAAAAELDAIAAAANVSEAMLVRAAQLDYGLRKDLL